MDEKNSRPLTLHGVQTDLAERLNAFMQMKSGQEY